jgi:hypothetical protein
MSDKDMPLTAVPLLSADLVKYRFDQIDGKMDKFDRKLDDLANNYYTKEEVNFLIDKNTVKTQDVAKQLETMRWYWRTIVAAVIVSLTYWWFNHGK